LTGELIVRVWPVSLVFFVLTAAVADAQEIDFRLPAGFEIEVLIDNVPNARKLALGEQGTLFVSTRRAGKVYAVREPFSGSPEVITIAEKLKMPNGVAVRGKDLYVAEMQRIVRFADIENRLESPGEPEIIDAALPYAGKLHAWKNIAFGPDDQLYVGLGAPCNICESPELSVILRMAPDGSGREVFARGVRNSVGMDWHPETGELWFTDNGRDMLGDDIPPCELNHAPEAGLDFGYPYCHGEDLSDPEFGDLGSCEESAAPAFSLGPHVAPLGMTFYTGDMFPAEYRNQIFIAEHGSWNRSSEAGKTGYRVTLVRMQNGKAVSYEPFLEGFLDGDKALGQPVDVLVADDGALLVADDRRGAIYRISYSGN
jgi:glucose/arabinose dehydrogenase